MTCRGYGHSILWICPKPRVNNDMKAIPVRAGIQERPCALVSGLRPGDVTPVPLNGRFLESCREMNASCSFLRDLRGALFFLWLWHC